MAGIGRQSAVERTLDLIEDAAVDPEAPAKATKCPATGHYYRGDTCPHCQVVHLVPAATTPEQRDDETDELELEEETDVAKPKTCAQGHARTKANTDSRGMCRQCAREYQRAYYRRKQGAAAGSKPSATTSARKSAKAEVRPTDSIRNTLAALREERDALAARLAKLDLVIASLEEIAA